MIDIHTIGAGGGSIAFVDQGGAFRVGPRSAGAVPGPAAYGRGGERPTVTDANVVLGRLDKDDFLGGAMKLDDTASHRVIDDLANVLSLSKLEAAEGVLTVINSNVANAIRSRTVQKGVDPREFEGWWYEGGGIYRHVYLTVLPPLHVAQWGTSVVASVPNGDQGASDAADIAIRIDLENSAGADAKCRVVCEIIAPGRESVATLELSDSVPANGAASIAQHTVIKKPSLWSVDSPQPAG